MLRRIASTWIAPGCVQFGGRKNVFTRPGPKSDIGPGRTAAHDAAMMDIFPSRGCVLSSEPVERRLTAILAADVAGYSRLIGADEEGTLAQLKAFRKTLLDPTIAKHRGRIVKTTGDGMLVEFASAVDAARCADGTGKFD